MRPCTWLVSAALVAAATSENFASAQDSNPQRARELRRTPVVEVFEARRDAVVNIAATQFVERRGFGDIDDMFDRFFDMPAGPRRTVRRTSVGSGFVLHEDGYIVTNAHVVARTAEQKVVFGDGTEFDAQTVAVDVEHDLAVLKIDAGHSLPTLPLGHSDDLMVGETVIAIGNPLGFQHTVTAGVVSALDRDIDINEQIRFEDLIQTDASINPGNSGGPLLNVLGELIGVNTAIRGDAQNIGFAIPVDQLRERLPEMLSIERRYRVETGLRLEESGGVRVAEVEPQSAAFEAGLRAGDTIQAIAGTPVSGLVDFHIGLLGHQPGEELDITVARDSTTIATTLELRERPMADGAALAEARFGIRLEQLGERDLAELGIRAPSALRIGGVERSGPGHEIDMQPGDLFVELNGQFPATLGDLGEMLEEIGPGQVVRVTFMRVSGRSRAQWTTNVVTK